MKRDNETLLRSSIIMDKTWAPCLKPLEKEVLQNIRIWGLIGWFKTNYIDVSATQICSQKCYILWQLNIICNNRNVEHNLQQPKQFENSKDLFHRYLTLERTRSSAARSIYFAPLNFRINIKRIGRGMLYVIIIQVAAV